VLWHPPPQYAGVEPQYPPDEQQAPNVEPVQIIPAALPQSPFVLTGNVDDVEDELVLVEGGGIEEEDLEPSIPTQT
jgi:hypothetical protein